MNLTAAPLFCGRGGVADIKLLPEQTLCGHTVLFG